MAFLHVLTHWFAHILHLYWRAPFKVYSSSWLMEYSHLMDFTHCLFSSNKQISNTWQVGQCLYQSLSGKISSLSTSRLMHEWHWWQIVWGTWRVTSGQNHVFSHLSWRPEVEQAELVKVHNPTFWAHQSQCQMVVAGSHCIWNAADVRCVDAVKSGTVYSSFLRNMI